MSAWREPKSKRAGGTPRLRERFSSRLNARRKQRSFWRQYGTMVSVHILQRVISGTRESYFTSAFYGYFLTRSLGRRRESRHSRFQEADVTDLRQYDVLRTSCQGHCLSLVEYQEVSCTQSFFRHVQSCAFVVTKEKHGYSYNHRRTGSRARPPERCDLGFEGTKARTRPPSPIKRRREAPFVSISS